jgi:hypothetical protein
LVLILIRILATVVETWLWFSSFTPETRRDCPPIRIQPLSSKSFQIHHSSYHPMPHSLDADSIITQPTKWGIRV